MVEKLYLIKYRCGVCGEAYNNETRANECESRPITDDKGVKVGDVVIITAGEGKGEKAVVKNRIIFDREWGHYMWERYWHSVGLAVNLLNNTGSRQLTYDCYRTINPED